MREFVEAQADQAQQHREYCHAYLISRAHEHTDSLLHSNNACLGLVRRALTLAGYEQPRANSPMKRVYGAASAYARMHLRRGLQAA